MSNREAITAPYIALYESGQLAIRAERLRQRLASCDICPRNCGVNRLEGETGYCHSGSEGLVASYCDHHGEEPVISGHRGSGTVFFANCNLRCLYCQNYQISQNQEAQLKNSVSPDRLADIMLELQSLGCHNINLVSPTHFIPQIVKSVEIAAGRGLRIPMVYNTNSYDLISTLKELEGIVSVYLPDLKYAGEESLKYSDAPEYSRYARLAIQEMYRQQGDLVTDTSGLAIKGVLVRHLVLPGDIAGTAGNLEWLAGEVSTGIGLSLMSQYHPSHRAKSCPELSRRIEAREYLKAVKTVKALGFQHAFLQGLRAPEVYLPDFEREKPFDA